VPCSSRKWNRYGRADPRSATVQSPSHLTLRALCRSRHPSMIQGRSRSSADECVRLAKGRGAKALRGRPLVSVITGPVA
jgi:hypothetical protein